METIALKKFARAHRAGYVKGPPAWLLTIRIPANNALGHFLANDLQVMHGRPEATVGFTKPVNVTNYPSMKPELIKIDEEGAPEQLLDEGYQLLRSKRQKV